MWDWVSLVKLWSHPTENSEAQGQHIERYALDGEEPHGRSSLQAPPARVCAAGQPGPSLMTFSSLFPSLHQCKYICLSALLAVIKEEREGGAIRSR